MASNSDVHDGTPSMTPCEYERLVADICQQLSEDREVKVYRREKMRGKSGQVHEIDVVVEFAHIGLQFVVLVECKWWNRPVGVEQVMVLAERLEDTGAHKGVIVTRTGYQEGAFTLAQSKGIALVLCQDPGRTFDVLLRKLSLPPADAGECGYWYYMLVGVDTARHVTLPQVVAWLVTGGDGGQMVADGP